jgi:hypothetical protein
VGGQVLQESDRQRNNSVTTSDVCREMISKSHVTGGGVMRTAWGMAAAVVAVGSVLAAPAGIALADTKSAEQTINELQTQGYTVNIDRIGSGPMSDCVVTGVRNPQQVSQWVPVAGPVLGGGDRNMLVQATVSKSISVSLDCTG